jgi:hypothetical protein
MQPVGARMPGRHGLLLLLWRVPMPAAVCTLLRDSVCIAEPDTDTATEHLYRRL